MLPLNLPTFAVKVTEKDGKQLIFDPIRCRYVILTPEEWVRQHFVNFLITEKDYPKELIANEACIKLNKTSKRCDTIVYNKFLKPLMIVEYKSPKVKISKETFEQIIRYNMVLQVEHLIVSNGIAHYCCKIDYVTGTYNFLKSIPEYNQL